MRLFIIIISLLSILSLSAIAAPAKGPLKALASNPRYFTDGSGKAIFLCGSTTWANMKDRALTEPIPPFDYNGYLDFLSQHNHNFFRLFAWDLPHSWNNNVDMKQRYIAPFPWPRTGPGIATDGKPCFDLSKFEQEYFDRMRTRVAAAGSRGIYVAVTLFGGFELQLAKSDSSDGFPYGKGNNINGIACGGDESQALTDTAVTRVQDAYVRKVVETLDDLDNVLYEISNESGPRSTEWQYHMIRLVKSIESKLPKQHPVGMTVQIMKGATNEPLFRSPADWIAPNSKAAPPYSYDWCPPPADGSKVVINDTDHSYYWIQLMRDGPIAHRMWVWMNLVRGNNMLFMDPYLEEWGPRNNPKDGKPDQYWEVMRKNMGYARTYADKMNLAAMVPHGELASTNLCLANPAKNNGEYLVYIPATGQVKVNLSGSEGDMKVEWYNPLKAETMAGNTVKGGTEMEFIAPFSGDAVLYLKQN